ncbi:Palmitoyltransferase ZDHHC6 [Anabarilius grahami]|uniref:Palmitoyltransferase ZDHHC6 n=1 Tax=Anabarilius grahami TaxID=495550 RepID=A0A3N0XN96_ANAGA|nr:Palmitoyltransferase ZDHHC6 [Anabarilius grahami]
MNILSAIIVFENLHEVKRLFHWGPIIALTVIGVCSSMAILDSIIWYWPLDTTGGSINFIMLINWTVLILYNYFNAMFVGPGYIPLEWKSISFGWSSVKIDMSAARHIHNPIMPFSIAAFAATLFALGLALGTTIAVGMLFFIQMKVILRNKTSIEAWIEEKAKDRIQYYQTGEDFIFPYDLGSRWENFKQVFTWSGTPMGDGIEWPVHEKCNQYTLTIEQLKQKHDKRQRSVEYRVVEDYNGACCPLGKGLNTFFRTPCTEEPRIKLTKGETIFATRGTKWWMYGDKVLNEEQAKAEVRIRGWFPRRCVEKCHYDSANNSTSEEKKEQ